MPESWPDKAGRLAALIPRDRLHPQVLAWSGAHPRSEWGVAFSGGPDSLALLLLLWAHWPKRRRRLCALHFDHRLRGRASRADADFCRRVSRGLGVPLATGVWRHPLREAGEAAAREARLSFLERACARRGIGALFFGHQQDDIAETLLMRLARGSGTGGLAAPRPVGAPHSRPRRHAGAKASGRPPAGPVRLRPLLTLKKAELVGALRACRIAWREDRSNTLDRFFRNRLRSRVIPQWVRTAGRDALAGAAWSRELLQEDDEALERWVAQRRAITPAGKLRLHALAGCPRAVWRRALHRWLQAQRDRAGSLSRAGFSALLAAAEAGRPTRISLGRDAFAVVRAGALFLEPGE